MAHSGVKNPKVQKEVEFLMRELESISSDLSSYFEYCQARQLFVKDLLGKSSQN